MSYFVYVSHRDPVDALVTARKLMEEGHYPFVPQLNKLIPGRKDEQWENYFKMWLFRCDCIFLTKSFRDHEKDWAMTNGISIVGTFTDLNNLKFPPFGELGRKFGEAVAEFLPVDQAWRKTDKAEAAKSLSRIAGLGAAPLEVARLCLKAWDRETNG